jgi:hypothetical protein
VIDSLNEFIGGYGWKIHDLGLDSQTVGYLNQGYEVSNIHDDDQYIQTVVNTAILSLLPALFSSNVIQTFDSEDGSKLSLFELEKIEKDNVYHQVLAKMNGLVGHCDTSFDGLKSKLNSFFSRVPDVQSLDAIQKVFDEMKDDLTSIKYTLQPQTSPWSVDLCTA